ncbi:hypothetical protein J3E71DRAFT_360457 [Bipolaris maydis]|nr:hypothetical protein J3E71DRAFT_360457 [Bipolaris maydis]
MPDECHDEAKVDQHPSHSYMQFFLMRNDSYINKYNGLTSMARQVNTGIAPCISTAAVIENTLSKYDYQVDESAYWRTGLLCARGVPYAVQLEPLTRLTPIHYDRSSSLRPRPADLEDVSYFTFLCSHAHRALENVEDYGWAKLMLHHPFRTLQDVFFLPEIHDEPCDACMEACEMSRERCTYPHDRFNDPLPNPEPSTHEDTQEDLDEEALSNMDAEWEHNVDWSGLVGTHPDLQADWWKISKADHSIGTCDIGPVTSYNRRKVKQKLLWDTFLDHFRGVSNEPIRRQLLLHIDGKGGTGKTTVIMSMCAEVEGITGNLGSCSIVVRVSPTGVAACNFGGSTLHSLLRLLVKDKVYQLLSLGNFRTLQVLLSPVSHRRRKAHGVATPPLS